MARARAAPTGAAIPNGSEGAGGRPVASLARTRTEISAPSTRWSAHPGLAGVLHARARPRMSRNLGTVHIWSVQRNRSTDSIAGSGDHTQSGGRMPARLLEKCRARCPGGGPTGRSRHRFPGARRSRSHSSLRPWSARESGDVQTVPQSMRRRSLMRRTRDLSRLLVQTAEPKTRSGPELSPTRTFCSGSE
jgi:hypothetical protein